MNKRLNKRKTQNGSIITILDYDKLVKDEHANEQTVNKRRTNGEQTNKVRDIDIHDIYNDLYYDFKRNMGLTDTEIIDKNVSLRGMMKPLEISEVMQIFKDIGFKVDISVKFNNFISIIAVK